MIKLQQELFLSVSLEDAWHYFATPRNLNEITPSDVVFEVISELPDKMYEGLLINYRLRPIFNIPINWTTEITHIKEKEYFIDEQRKGPYRIWHHEHHFKAVAGGVIMTDLLYYDIGKSFIGWLAGKLFVHQKVQSIFEYRSKILETFLIRR